MPLAVGPTSEVLEVHHVETYTRALEQLRCVIEWPQLLKVRPLLLVHVHQRAVRMRRSLLRVLVMLVVLVILVVLPAYSPVPTRRQFPRPRRMCYHHAQRKDQTSAIGGCWWRFGPARQLGQDGTAQGEAAQGEAAQCEACSAGIALLCC